MPATSSSKALLRALEGDTAQSPPLWLMRQAGRYLPEYRALRLQAPTFLDFCYTPRLACEATLQPIRRFDFDAAILFSDILVIPDALGQPVSFETGSGPRLTPLDRTLKGLRHSADLSRLNPVFETIAKVKAELPRHVALIGFCGAPWTLATYMAAGQGTPDQRPARLFAYEDPQNFERLIEILVQASIAYLCEQVRAGVEAIQIFDSWAGVLPPDQLMQWSVAPIGRIIDGVRARYPATPFIVFAKGAAGALARYAQTDGVRCLGLDTGADLRWARGVLPNNVCIQGNLDPIVALAGGDALDRAIDHVLAGLGGGPAIFNLGHGVLPETPIAHIERLTARVRAWRP